MFEGEEFSNTAIKNACTKSLSSEIKNIPISPCVFVKSHFFDRTSTTFVVGFGRTRSEAMSNAKDELQIPESRSIRLVRELYYSAQTASGGSIDHKMAEALLSVFHPSKSKTVKTASPKAYGKGSIYA